MAEVIRIEAENRRVITNIGWAYFDFLVIASGSKTNFFGLDQVERNSVGLKNIRDALGIRSWILQNQEKATIVCNLVKKEALTNFAIIGGGPAGVELAGALDEFKCYLLKTIA